MVHQNSALQSPIRSHPSEETICAYPLRWSSPQPHGDVLSVERQAQLAQERLTRVTASLQSESPDRLLVRSDLDQLFLALPGIVAHSAELSTAVLLSLVERIQRCRTLLQPDKTTEYNSAAPDLEKLEAFHSSLAVVLQRKLSLAQKSSVSETSSTGSQDISELKDTVTRLADCVEQLSGVQATIGKQLQMYSMKGQQPQMFGQDADTLCGALPPSASYHGAGEWSQARQQECREMTVSTPQNGMNGQQAVQQRVLEGMNSDQIRLLAMQGLMSRVPPAYPPPVPQVNVHNLISTDAHAAAATEQNTTQQSSIVNKVKNTLKQARANLVPLLIGGAIAMLFHNHIPILKRISPGGRGRSRLHKEDLSRERHRTRRTAAAAEEAIEECADAMREWREYARRDRGWFQNVPEPSAKCDVRALRSQVMRQATTVPEGSTTRDNKRGSYMNDGIEDTWRMLLR